MRSTPTQDNRHRDIRFVRGLNVRWTYVSRYDSRGEQAFQEIECFEFYEQAKNAYAIVYCSEYKLYANLMLQKGVLKPEDYVPDSCNRENAKWLRAKSNTVDMMAMSSLHVAAMLYLEGQKLEDKKMNSVDYGTYGGGFPLMIKGMGMVGTICVSGLWHFDDHALIVETLKEFMKA